MTLKRIVLTICVFSLTSTWVFGYEEINCSSDPIFSANSCNQCFDWWQKWEWVNIWLLSDKWINSTDKSILMYKEEQEMPSMINLGWTSVSWSQQPSSENFWEYTSDLEALYSSDYEWYILWAWNETSWIQSKLWYAYSLDKNSLETGKNIWLLVYPMSMHIITDWEAAIETEVHKECVLYKSWEPEDDIVIPTPPKKLPDTWPAEYMLLMVIAILWWALFMKFLRKA